jgi:hypothetical protein
VLNNISKFISSRQLKFPLTGLLIAGGILGLGIIDGQTKVNLKSQVIAANLPIHANQIQTNNSENSLLSKLREIRVQRNQSSANNPENKDSAPQAVSGSGNSVIIPTKIIQAEVKSPESFPETDGIYLYGQSSVPGQLGQGYIVFNKQQGKVTGALYMPGSEYSCFQGTLAKSGELAMTVTSSPGEVGPVEVSTTSQIPRLTDEDAMTYAYSVTLKDYHQLQSVSANDREILQGCSQDLNGGNQ